MPTNPLVSNLFSFLPPFSTVFLLLKSSFFSLLAPLLRLCPLVRVGLHLLQLVGMQRASYREWKKQRRDTKRRVSCKYWSVCQMAVMTHDRVVWVKAHAGDSLFFFCLSLVILVTHFSFFFSSFSTLTLINSASVRSCWVGSYSCQVTSVHLCLC